MSEMPVATQPSEVQVFRATALAGIPPDALRAAILQASRQDAPVATALLEHASHVPAYWVRRAARASERLANLGLLPNRDIAGSCVGSWNLAWVIQVAQLAATDGGTLDQATADEPPAVSALSGSAALLTDDERVELDDLVRGASSQAAGSLEQAQVLLERALTPALKSPEIAPLFVGSAVQVLTSQPWYDPADEARRFGNLGLYLLKDAISGSVIRVVLDLRSSTPAAVDKFTSGQLAPVSASMSGAP